MRLYVIPVLKNRWVYYCHSTTSSTSRLTQAVDWASRKWEALNNADHDSWKKKLYVRGTSLINQLEYQEWFFKSIPSKEDIEKPLNKVCVQYPSCLLEEIKVKQELEELVKTRIPYHKKYMWYSAYWVPIACTFVVVPLIPNIPLAYNLFRLYSHYKALKGAEHLQSLIDYGSLDYTVDPRMEAILGSTLKTESNLDFPIDVQNAFKTSPNKPDLITLEQEIDGVLSPKQIKELVQVLEMPGLEVELSRARMQILKSIATKRFATQNNKIE
ncbi:mitochondrial K+-H+ exchange-related-domain-containing protein [Cokeromyces recurvatus]|uniref:mitochondrial K+-H+ exchange-related-domain-containing protein n=1 Tax=Cokeromyces recurvatus TaxID=90255 RepID=UPI0022206CD3|nr:mitochondrial K+-H+ exchange-related-domain-containing protein [Cokeromyces recurvatus]KAI7900988.1 mitochondrial K+-H+ exchange-related-domain-containing protein [Cokeromyces recurvatus]